MIYSHATDPNYLYAQNLKKKSKFLHYTSLNEVVLVLAARWQKHTNVAPLLTRQSPIHSRRLSQNTCSYLHLQRGNLICMKKTLHHLA